MPNQVRAYDGRKLLVLGSSTGAVDIVSHARANGALVYVADNLSPENSPAKLLADKTVSISVM